MKEDLECVSYSFTANVLYIFEKKKKKGYLCPLTQDMIISGMVIYVIGIMGYFSDLEEMLWAKNNFKFMLNLGMSLPKYTWEGS